MPDCHPEDIKARVRKRGLTLEAIARRAGMSGGALRQALSVPRSQGELAIAAALGVHPMEIWPSRYRPDGERKRPQPVDNYRHVPRFGNAASAR